MGRLGGLEVMESFASWLGAPVDREAAYVDRLREDSDHRE